MNIVLVTGMSGAGKSTALNTLEDAGYEAIDNIPLSLIAGVARSTPETKPLAIGADIRSRNFTPEEFIRAIDALRQDGAKLSIVYLDCDDDALKRRYTETRRKHPLALDRPVEDGLRQERRLLHDVRDCADIVIDTTDLTGLDLRRRITAHFIGSADTLSVNLMSFSFKRGLPREADMVLDVRFLQNPHYEPLLRPLTGREWEVGQFIERDAAFAPFIEQTKALFALLLPRYRDEGKSYLTVAIGCTGGRHRSVYVAERLSGFFQELSYKCSLKHRDLESA